MRFSINSKQLAIGRVYSDTMLGTQPLEAIYPSGDTPTTSGMACTVIHTRHAVMTGCSAT
jgi:hypothetical protein